MVPWEYPFSTECQYYHTEGQWPTLVKIDFAYLLDTMYVTSTKGPQDADLIQTNTPWMIVPSSDDFRSKYSWRSIETPQGGRDPSVIASVTGWSRLRIVLCYS